MKEIKNELKEIIIRECNYHKAVNGRYYANNLYCELFVLLAKKIRNDYFSQFITSISIKDINDLIIVDRLGPNNVKLNVAIDTLLNNYIYDLILEVVKEIDKDLYKEIKDL